MSLQNQASALIAQLNNIGDKLTGIGLPIAEKDTLQQMADKVPSNATVVTGKVVSEKETDTKFYLANKPSIGIKDDFNSMKVVDDGVLCAYSNYREGIGHGVMLLTDDLVAVQYPYNSAAQTNTVYALMADRGDKLYVIFCHLQGLWDYYKITVLSNGAFVDIGSVNLPYPSGNKYSPYSKTIEAAGEYNGGIEVFGNRSVVYFAGDSPSSWSYSSSLARVYVDSNDVISSTVGSSGSLSQPVFSFGGEIYGAYSNNSGLTYLSKIDRATATVTNIMQLTNYYLNLCFKTDDGCPWFINATSKGEILKFTGTGFSSFPLEARGDTRYTSGFVYSMLAKQVLAFYAYRPNNIKNQVFDAKTETFTDVECDQTSDDTGGGVYGLLPSPKNMYAFDRTSIRSVKTRTQSTVESTVPGL